MVLFMSTPSLLRSSTRSQLLLILVSLVKLSVTLDPNAPVSIDQLPAWSSQRDCGRGCLQNTFNGGPDVTKVLGCQGNACFCGTQYQADASSIITSCLQEFCGSNPELVTFDISSAISIYDSYCGIANVAAATTPTNVQATTTANIDAGTTSPASTNQVPAQTGTGSSGETTSAPSATGSAKSSGSSLSSGGIAGIAISAATAFIGLCATIWFKYLRYKLAVRRDKRHEMQQRGWS